MARTAACLGMVVAMTVGLAVVVPANSFGGPTANGRTTVRAQEERIKPSRKSTQRQGQRAGAPPRHLRAVSDAEKLEPESVVLSRVVAAMDEALKHPSLSTDWHAALASARRHLAQAAVAPRRE